VDYLVGEKIRTARLIKGWSQERLGAQIGLDESSARARISRYELGVNEPPVLTVRLIAKELQPPLAYFYNEDEDLDGLLVKWNDTPPEKMRKCLISLSNLD
jgi:transcriptional regulator with XRE-family HTH domain